MGISQTGREDADTLLDTEDAWDVFYRLVHAVSTGAGAVGVVVVAVYVSVAVPHSPSLYLALWFVVLLALAALPTITAAVLVAAVRMLPSPFSTGEESAPAPGSTHCGTERTSDLRGYNDGRAGRQRGANDGCPCVDD